MLKYFKSSVKFKKGYFLENLPLIKGVLKSTLLDIANPNSIIHIIGLCLVVIYALFSILRLFVSDGLDEDGFELGDGVESDGEAMLNFFTYRTFIGVFAFFFVGCKICYEKHSSGAMTTGTALVVALILSLIPVVVDFCFYKILKNIGTTEISEVVPPIGTIGLVYVHSVELKKIVIHANFNGEVNKVVVDNFTSDTQVPSFTKVRFISNNPEIKIEILDEKKEG